MSLATQLKGLDSLIDAKKLELTKITALKKKEMAPLLKRREELLKKIHTHIKVNGLTSYQGVKLPEKKEKKQKPNRQIQMAKLRQMGIRNPDAALKEIGL